MEIKTTIKNRSGELKDVLFVQCDSLDEEQAKLVPGVRAYCFYGDKLVLAYDRAGFWTVPGGGMEEGETFEQAVIREVKEESNMEVLEQVLMGYLEFIDSGKRYLYTNSVCRVRPYGDFAADPDEDITEIMLVDPKDIKTYFDRGEVGDLLMKRALELKAKLF